jgi:hypothetical protein
MKNKLSDLNDLLFAEMERLGAEDLVLNKEKLENETLAGKLVAGIKIRIRDLKRGAEKAGTKAKKMGREKA